MQFVLRLYEGQASIEQAAGMNFVTEADIPVIKTDDAKPSLTSPSSKASGQIVICQPSPPYQQDYRIFGMTPFMHAKPKLVSLDKIGAVTVVRTTRSRTGRLFWDEGGIRRMASRVPF